MTAIGILGKGGAGTPAEVITEGLRDVVVSDTDRVLIPWFGKPIPADLEVVYDWVLDNEVPFAMYADDVSSAPKAFRTSEFGKVIEGDPRDSIIAGCSTLLYLWDDDGEVFARMEEAKKSPHLVMDLTAGLIPIEIEDGDDRPAPSADDDTADDFGFSDLNRAELESMPALAVKRYASAKLGETFPTKAAAIDALMDDIENKPAAVAAYLAEIEENDPTDDAPTPSPAVADDLAKVSGMIDSVMYALANSNVSGLYCNQAIFRLTEARMWTIAAFTDKG